MSCATDKAAAGTQLGALQSKIMALTPQHEYNYIWPSDKASYRDGFAEGKAAAAALAQEEEAKK